MSAVKTIRRRIVVGRYTATITVPLVAGAALGITVEWDRARPPRLSSAELARYRQLRNAVLQRVATEIGAAILVADSESDGSLVATVIRPAAENA